MTLALSWQKNPPVTSLSRAAIAFLILYGAVYAVRWLWGFAFSPEEGSAESTAGRNIDLATPSDDKQLLQEMLSDPQGESPAADEFVPLNPEKLVSKDKLDPALMARSVRQMSED